MLYFSTHFLNLLLNKTLFMKSFVENSESTDFSIYNIPFGVAVFNQEYIACATRIGNQVIDLATLYDEGYFENIDGLMIISLKLTL